MRRRLSSKKSGIPIKSPDEINKIRKACAVTVTILEELKGIIQPGISTEDINSFVHRRTIELGGTPAPLNYKGFPKSVCTSPNEVICHGIPSPEVVLKKGDIINVDVTTIVDGYFGDASRMYFVGGEEACSSEAVELVKVTYEALRRGIEAVRPGARFGDIGAAIEQFIRETGKGYGIVREYTGHGVGRAFHEPPQIPHFGRGGIGPIMEVGMTFTIEPMINLGTHKAVLSREDKWTVRTADGKLSAQWEETVAVTEDGVEVLTKLS